MTPAERAVLARYPDAECWRGATLNGGYVVHRVPLDVDAAIVAPILGTGPTPDAAWADAAARLTTEGA